MQNKLQQGFSLIEILVAAAIASILAIILYRAFSQTMAVVQRVNTQIDENGQTLSTGAQLEKDFSAIFMPFSEEVKKEKSAQAAASAPPGQQTAAQPETAKEEKTPEIIPFSTTAADGKLATISFVTTNAFAVLDEITPRCVRVVYRFMPEENQGTQGTLYRLVREEMPYNQKAEIEKKTTKPQYAYALIRNMQTFEVEFSTAHCQDSEEIITLKEWGTAMQKKKCPKVKIPAFVKISYTLLGSKGDMRNSVTHLLTVPAGLCPQEEEKVPAKAPEAGTEKAAGTPAIAPQAQAASPFLQPAKATSPATPIKTAGKS